MLTLHGYIHKLSSPLLLLLLLLMGSNPIRKGAGAGSHTATQVFRLTVPSQASLLLEKKTEFALPHGARDAVISAPIRQDLSVTLNPRGREAAALCAPSSEQHPFLAMRRMTVLNLTAALS